MAASQLQQQQQEHSYGQELGGKLFKQIYLIMVKSFLVAFEYLTQSGILTLISCSSYKTSPVHILVMCNIQFFHITI